MLAEVGRVAAEVERGTSCGDLVDSEEIGIGKNLAVSVELGIGEDLVVSVELGMGEDLVVAVELGIGEGLTDPVGGDMALEVTND